MEYNTLGHKVFDFMFFCFVFCFGFFLFIFFFTSNKVKVHRALIYMHTHSLTHLLTY